MLAEHLTALDDPLALLVQPVARVPTAHVVRHTAAALLDFPSAAPQAWPDWLAPHQIPAAQRLTTIISRYGGGVLADAPGLGKSYVALAVARAISPRLLLVVPAVLLPQWGDLLERFGRRSTQIVTHESLSRQTPPQHLRGAQPMVVVDEAHRFRNPATRRYRALARLVIGSPVLLVTATPLHNRTADLLHLLRLFLRDDALTALGVPSLARVARGEDRRDLGAVTARLIVARSRAAVRQGYGARNAAPPFPSRLRGETVRIATAPPDTFARLVQEIRVLPGDAAPLLRLALLRRLGSSLAALRTTLKRHEALLHLGAVAAREGRVLTRRDFQRLFSRTAELDLQLAFLPLMLTAGAASRPAGDQDALRRLYAFAAPAPDPKGEALAQLLAARPGKTIVFTDALATVKHLMMTLSRRVRAGAVFGDGGRLGDSKASRREVLRAFAPLAQHTRRPTAALEVDVLIATDLLSEGLNLQDAVRVVHYDLPWSPARLAQRVGRVDRLGSPHNRIESIAFLPAEPLATALDIEGRLAAKIRFQVKAGAAAVEGPGGADLRGGVLDWCDRLQALAGTAGPMCRRSWAAVHAPQPVVVVAFQIGGVADLFVVRHGHARTDPRTATALLEQALASPDAADGLDAVRAAIRHAVPLVRARLTQLLEARWRAADRDRRARRLIPLVLSSARTAAREADAARLGALDDLVTRLSTGMTAGEELLLDDLLGRPAPLGVDDLLAWAAAVPPVAADDTAPRAELLGAIAFVTPQSRQPSDTSPTGSVD